MPRIDDFDPYREPVHVSALMADLLIDLERRTTAPERPL